MTSNNDLDRGKSSLKTTAIRASAVEIVGFGGSQIIRLGSNLVLSRLLFEGDFGLAAFVMIFNQGLVMMSDVGIGQSLIRSSRADQPSFEDTAWTLQVVRGLGLWIIACVLAWPLAWYFANPQLLTLIPAGSTVVIINGFTSTSVYLLRRDLRVTPLVALELLAQSVSSAVIITWSLLAPSIWALVCGPLSGELVKAIASYFVGHGRRHRLRWDSSASDEIVRFGKWIFASSSLCFISTQGDRLMLMKLLGEATLGIYNQAVIFSSAIGLVVTRITQGVLYPVLSRIQRERPQSFVDSYYRTRLRTDCLGLIPLGTMFSLSEWLIHFLYEDRWAAAGWMLRALCVRVALQMLHTPCETALFSLGHTKFSFYRDLLRTIILFTIVPLCYHHYDIAGLVWAISLAELPPLLLLWFGALHHGILRLPREALTLPFFGLGALVGWLMSAALPDPWWK